MNYKKMIYDNQKINGYKLISINEKFCTIECSECGAIKNMNLNTFKKQYYEKRNNIHNWFCSKYYLDKIKKEYGNIFKIKFYNIYKYIHERCNNKNNKDFNYYKGMCKFEDFTDFYKKEFNLFSEASKNISLNEIYIDRIDYDKPYEEDNIRFVTMFDNLQNNKNVKPVKMTNIKTGEIIVGKSFGDLARNYKNVSYSSTLYNSFKEKKLYKKEWKIEFNI